MSAPVDLLVIGGGINGAGIARDAAGRGLSVLLVEQHDLAQHTSSASTKLVHGGLRYLEHYEFRLVREALAEREVLLAAAPHIVWPLRFVLPHDAGLRPRWMLRLGLFLYDRIGGRRTLPDSGAVDLARPPHDAILADRFAHGFQYSDCWVEDARMTVLAAVDARERGADIRTRTRCTGLERRADCWTATLESDGGQETVTARAVVNAAGPWVDTVASMALGAAAPARLRLVKGSHLVVRRHYEGDHAYIFQHPDKRIVFAIPYERDYTLIGTTDAPFEGDPAEVTISEVETDYLLSFASDCFARPVRRDDVVSTYAGVRPLYEDSAASDATVTRDYVLAVDAGSDGDAPPILSVFGGKITTFRKLAEAAIARFRGHLPVGEAWTREAPLPGGDLDDFDEFVARYAWLPARLARRLARAYGTRIDAVLDGARSLDDLGPLIGGTLSRAELRYLVREEFARSAKDVLWRRSKLGLHFSPAEVAEVEDWFAAETASPAGTLQQAV